MTGAMEIIQPYVVSYMPCFQQTGHTKVAVGEQSVDGPHYHASCSRAKAVLLVDIAIPEFFGSRPSSLDDDWAIFRVDMRVVVLETKISSRQNKTRGRIETY